MSIKIKEGTDIDHFTGMWVHVFIFFIYTDPIYRLDLGWWEWLKYSLVINLYLRP